MLVFGVKYVRDGKRYVCDLHTIFQRRRKKKHEANEAHPKTFLPSISARHKKRGTENRNCYVRKTHTYYLSAFIIGILNKIMWFTVCIYSEIFRIFNLYHYRARENWVEESESRGELALLHTINFFLFAVCVCMCLVLHWPNYHISAWIKDRIYCILAFLNCTRNRETLHYKNIFPFSVSLHLSFSFFFFLCVSRSVRFGNKRKFVLHRANPFVSVQIIGVRARAHTLHTHSHALHPFTPHLQREQCLLWAFCRVYASATVATTTSHWKWNRWKFFAGFLSVWRISYMFVVAVFFFIFHFFFFL